MSTAIQLKEMEHDLHYWVAFMILPLFAFVNAGIDFKDISLGEMTGPVPIGILLGSLFSGLLGYLVLRMKTGK